MLVSIELKARILEARVALNKAMIPLDGRVVRLNDPLIDGAMVFGFAIQSVPTYHERLITFHRDDVEYVVFDKEVVRRIGKFCPDCGQSLEHKCNPPR